MAVNTFLLSFILIITMSNDLLMAQNPEIDQMLNKWHAAAARADQQAYFSYFTDDAVYIGTDSSEIWTRDQFYRWASPYFEKGKAWSFKANSRNVYVDGSGKIAWFDELLDYGKGTLRGSGVLSKQADGWKIRHYVLSLPVPNDKFKAVVELLDEVSEKREHEE